MIRALALCLCLAAPAVAESCGTVADSTAEIDALIARAQAADSYPAGAEVMDAMWEVWMRAPDGWSGELMDLAQESLGMRDPERALKALDELVAYCPGWAEGWNQRGYARFLAGDTEGALADVDRALAIAPNHVAAIAGRGVILWKAGDEAAGRAEIARAIALHPWLPERGLLMAPEGTKL